MRSEKICNVQNIWFIKKQELNQDENEKKCRENCGEM